jgi:hypothetical protein
MKIIDNENAYLEVYADIKKMLQHRLEVHEFVNMKHYSELTNLLSSDITAVANALKKGPCVVSLYLGVDNTGANYDDVYIEDASMYIKDIKDLQEIIDDANNTIELLTPLLKPE